MILKDFNETFAEELRDPDFVAAYLDEALEDGEDTFLVALQNVAKAQGGMTELANATSLGRESLYKSLSKQGNPRLKNLRAILGAFGVRLSIERRNTSTP